MAAEPVLFAVFLHSSRKNESVKWKHSFMAAIVSLALLVGGASNADAATRIRFKKGSYCGIYAGNFRNGKTFVLELSDGQRFTTRNIGRGYNTNFFVTGPTGELEPSRDDAATLSYYTEESGDHYIKIVSTVARASVEFCAY
jgi:hypothetical protein